MIYAYIRVSSDTQTVENQRLSIEKAGYFVDVWLCDEGVSGIKDWKIRDIKKAVTKAVAGDTIVVAELSRLGRSLKQILEIVEICQEKKVSVVLLREAITIADTNPFTKLLVSILGSLAEMERNLISERTKDGLARTRAGGTVLGRPVGAKTAAAKRKLTGLAPQIELLRDAGISKQETALMLGVNRMTLNAFIDEQGIDWHCPRPPWMDREPLGKGEGNDLL